MKNFAVICFLVAVTAVLFVQRISGEDGFWYGEELHDVEKRQTWNAFCDKHVVEAPGTKKDANVWNQIARERLGTDYGVRLSNTFIRVQDKNLILTSFFRRRECSNGYTKSDKKFSLVEMTWNAASGKYSVNFPGEWYICVKVAANRQPLDFHGRE
ncbi:hypothetical protein HOLleu_16133 [Holothuria leucospilota]|uniref:Uncharacterized protein n=1 Tax=Holothuria leucospilota TaxID=206669 RepID=A0A9Q1C5Q6_HOLLE|nr:hypothetical protein HOLleu_16133 [Holothuria leucospilota]